MTIFSLVGLCFGMLARLFRGRRSLLLENLALRQEPGALKRRDSRPSINPVDKLFLGNRSTGLVRLEALSHHRYARNRRALAPDWFSYVLATNFQSQEAGWKKTDIEGGSELTFRMVVKNPSWGVPRVHGELRMLGFELSERTISRWMKRAPRDPDRAECWLTFLRNHREAIAAMDFFTVPTITFGVLYCLFVISHERRRILHTNVTKHPTSGWITQQLREAFPLEASLKYLIFDGDRKFGFEVITAVKAIRIIAKRTSFRSPWQNGIAERWVGSCRRNLLDQIIALGPYPSRT